MNKIIAKLLVVVMVMTTVVMPANFSFAETADGQQEAVTEPSSGAASDDASKRETSVDQKTESQTKQSDAGTTESKPGAAQQPSTSDSSTDAANEEVEQLVTEEMKFLYVESPQLVAPGTQNLVVSWKDSIDEITKMVLVYENSKGEQFELEEKDRTDKSILFTKDFSAAEAGTYIVKGVKYYVGETEEYFAFDDVEIDADFEVISEKQASGTDENITIVENSGDSVNSSSVKKQVKQALSSADVDVSAAPKSRAAARNVVVVLDPGHGGSDVGARYGSFYERDVNLKIAQACYNELTQYNNVTVYMTRTNNTSASLSLAQRAAFAQSKGADVLISIHNNAGGGGSARGVEIWKPNKNYNYSVYTEGAGLSSSILSELVKLGLYNRGLKERLTANNTKYPDGSLADYYGIIRESKLRGITGIIIEHAYIDNASDRAFLSNDSNLVKLGKADALGIANYFGLSKGKWVDTPQGKKFQYNNGTFAIGYINIGGRYYYFNEQGIMQTGFQMINGNLYYFKPDGAGVEKGWVQFGNGTQGYCIANGKLAVGQVLVGDSYYYFDQNGINHKGAIQETNGKVYYFYENDIPAVRGWITDGNRRMWSRGNGELVTGHVCIGADYYYFDENGAAQKGHHVIGGRPYYFQADYAGAVKGWVTDGNRKMWSRGSGELVTGRVYIGTGCYYFDGNGIAQKGHHVIGGRPYYFQADYAGAVKGWVTDGNRKMWSKGSGELVTGRVYIGTGCYYFDGNGIAQKGHHVIGGRPYYFQADYAGAVKGWVTDGNRKMWSRGSGELVTGRVYIGTGCYYFDDKGILGELTGKVIMKDGKPYYQYSDGSYAVKGWVTDGNRKMWSRGSGELVTGRVYIGTGCYYFDGNGIAQKGYHVIGGKPYYFQSNYAGAVRGWITDGNRKMWSKGNGELVTGRVCIGADYYRFDNNGILTDVEGCYAISGSSQTTVSQMVRYYKSFGKAYPSSVYSSKGAATIEQFCQIYYEEAKAEGIRAEVAFCQAMKETGWLQFGGVVKKEQCNFAGIGATDNGGIPATFPDVRTGVRAQIQHLKAYANSAALKNPCVDPRFTLVTRGTAPYVEWLGIKENPYGKGWATAKNYGYDIVAMINTLLKK